MDTFQFSQNKILLVEKKKNKMRNMNVKKERNRDAKDASLEFVKVPLHDETHTT